MADIGQQRASPPGWYPDGPARLRWWDGARWTDHLAVPEPRRTRASRLPGDRLLVLGAIFLVVACAGVVVGGLAGFGDPYPISRAGVAADAAGLAVVNAVCPAERVREIALLQQTASGAYVELWHITGDAPLPPRVTVGATLAGMQTVVPLREPIDPDTRLAVRVVTSELDSPYEMEFVARDVPAVGVLSFGDVHRSVNAFERAAFADTPCGDPYSDSDAQAVTMAALVFSGAVGLVGLALLLLARARRIRSAH